MTTDVLPAAEVPAAAAHHDRTARAQNPARTAERKIPFHLGVTLGLSAGIYAVALAGVAVLQAQENSRLAGDSAAAVDAVALLERNHEEMEARIGAAAEAYSNAAAAYAAVAQQVPGYEDTLRSLAQALTRINGMSAALPTRASLPRVSAGRVVVRTRPATQATTGASGR